MATALALPEGLVTDTLTARSQVVSGTYRGYLPATTKDGRDMYVLHFEQEGKLATINMMASADRPVLEVGREYTARWVDKTFSIVEGLVDVDTGVVSDADPFV
jgi:hypothetical protein